MVRSARRDSLWALAVIALFVIGMAGSTAGCSSDTPVASDSQAAPSTQATSNTTSDVADGRSPGGRPGMPGGTRPSGGPGMATPSSDSTTTTTAADAETTTTEAPTTTTSLADGRYGDGIYRAGTDIDTGLYKGTVVNGPGHWEIASDAAGVRYVASGDPTGQFYVKVTWGQYLRLSGGVIEEASSTATDPLASTDLTDGTYRVGYDIEAGWYTGTVTGTSTIGYWQISSDANGQTLVAGDYPMDAFTFKVTKGQYLTLRSVTVSLQK